MKLTKNFFAATITALFFVIGISLLASCVKERDHDILAAEDASFALWAYDNAINLANEAASGNLSDLLNGYCASVTMNPNQYVINFDTVNCLCRDGRTRRGKIIVDFTGTYKDSNETRIITFDDYYINDNKIRGSETITGLGTDANSNLYYSVAVDGIIDVLDTLGALTYTADLSRTWSAGANTVQWGDDVYMISGNGHGVNIYGNNYAFNALEPIIKPTAITCRYFTQGILEVQPQGRTFRSIDFGNGSCDKIATVTIDNKQHNMVLK